MRNILCVDWNNSLPVAASRVVTRITAVERPLCKGSVVTSTLQHGTALKKLMLAELHTLFTPNEYVANPQPISPMK